MGGTWRQKYRNKIKGLSVLSQPGASWQRGSWMLWLLPGDSQVKTCISSPSLVLCLSRFLTTDLSVPSLHFLTAACRDWSNQALGVPGSAVRQ